MDHNENIISGVKNRAYLPEGYLFGSAENREYISTVSGLERAMASGRTVEGIAVLCDEELNLTVELCPGVRGIIPREEAVYVRGEEEEVKDIAIITRVGKAVCFKVTRLERGEGGVTAFLSRRLAQKECAEKYVYNSSALRKGDIIPAKITHLEHFGAFADIGCGLVALLPIDCISVSRISHPRDRFRNGIRINAAVKEIDYESGRIFLSSKELLGTWEENAARFSPGQTVAGIIRSVEDYGIFVELAPNLAGLAEYKPEAAMPDTIGQTAAVYIKSIIPERMKIKLVLIGNAAEQGSTAEFSALADQFSEKYESERHISYWRYSPDCSERVIETVFD